MPVNMPTRFTSNAIMVAMPRVTIRVRVNGDEELNNGKVFIPKATCFFPVRSGGVKRLSLAGFGHPCTGHGHYPVLKNVVTPGVFIYCNPCLVAGEMVVNIQGKYQSCPDERIVARGQVISNRAPFWCSPVSFMVIPVILRISRERKRPRPEFLPNPYVKIFSFSSAGTPAPSSSQTIVQVSFLPIYLKRIVVVDIPPCRMTFSIRLEKTFSISGSAYSSIPAGIAFSSFILPRVICSNEFSTRVLTLCQTGDLIPTFW